MMAVFFWEIGWFWFLVLHGWGMGVVTFFGGRKLLRFIWREEALCFQFMLFGVAKQFEICTCAVLFRS